MWKIGHRGASGTYPENTLLAFSKAIELGANALELDVFSCKSGEAVVIHDATLERTTNGHGRVDAHTLSELKTLDAGRGECIPTLKDVLSAFAREIIVFIEIKEASVTQSVAKLILEFAKSGVPYAHMPVIGFNESWLIATRDFDPNIVIGITPDDTKPLSRSDCEHAKRIGAWSINPCIDHLDQSFVEYAHALDLKIITWTANTDAQIAKAKSLRPDGIISDYPENL